MHETIIAKQIIEQAKKSAKGRNIKSITLEIGDLAHIPSHELKETLETMVKWKINIKTKKAIVKCSCGFKGNPLIVEKAHDHTIYKCKKCSSMMPAILDGKDIVLKKIDITNGAK